VLHFWMPSVPPELFAVIGMGTIIAAAINAPLTAIMIVLQLTGAFQILPALVAAIAASTLLARFMHPGSIYTITREQEDVMITAEEAAGPRVIGRILNGKGAGEAVPGLSRRAEQGAEQPACARDADRARAPLTELSE
jgi:hypothetical protein